MVFGIQLIDFTKRMGYPANFKFRNNQGFCNTRNVNYVGTEMAGSGYEGQNLMPHNLQQV